jgi:predicted nuclease of restriction endonuclease-like (RecB) superfamily
MSDGKEASLVPMSACFARIREHLETSRATALRAVNEAMVSAYWLIGREIVEEEQRGAERAEYGAQLIETLSRQLRAEYGRGFSISNLRYMRQFFLTYSERLPRIHQTPSGESSLPDALVKGRFLEELSWSHYVVLLRVGSPEARGFYEAECAKARWSVRELERQISTLLFERLARSRDKDGLLALTREGHDVHRPADLVKDPYVLEFLDLPEAGRWREGELEQALIDRLQDFLLELGRDLFFVARQKRITLDGDHFYIDLVFYHRVLRCFLLIDLKLGKLSHGDIGQMQMYTGYYEAEERRDDENPPIGLILCADKNEAAVRYTLSQSASQIYTSRYQLHLPSPEELEAELLREREQIERQLRLNAEDDARR